MSLDRSYNEPDKSASQLLKWAVAISVACHLFIWGAYRVLITLHRVRDNLILTMLMASKPAAPLAPKHTPKTNPLLVEEQQPTLTFVEVDPSVAVVEAPKNAKYYSSKNSQAANVEAIRENSSNPKLTGTQAVVPKTSDTQRSKASPLQPSPPKLEADEKKREESEHKPKPQGGKPVGDLAMMKPQDHPGEKQSENSKDPGETIKPAYKRANTLVEAKARQSLAGQQMKQEGGVKHRLSMNALDTIATPFGEYDRQIIEAIQEHWDDILERMAFSRDRSGRVVLEFDLHYDGRITDMKVIESTVDDILCYACQRAVQEPAPYDRWPEDLRRLYREDKKTVIFTFNYL